MVIIIITVVFLTSYRIFSPILAFLSCSRADFLPTFSLFSRLERDFAKLQASPPSSKERDKLTWRHNSRCDHGGLISRCSFPNKRTNAFSVYSLRSAGVQRLFIHLYSMKTLAVLMHFMLHFGKGILRTSYTPRTPRVFRRRQRQVKSSLTTLDLRIKVLA